MRTLIFLMTFSTAAMAAQAVGQERINVARGKKYTLRPRPNYRYCTDSADGVQLTDGVYSKGYFWTQKTTVGWSGANPAAIELDLESVQPISGLSFNTAAGVAGVEWPASILILVGNDNRVYTYVGDLVELSARHGRPKEQGYSVHRFHTEDMAAYGRYVKLLVSGGGAYTFVDEIEIYRGDNISMSKPLQGRRVRNTDEFFAERQITQGVRRRLRYDLAAVRRSVQHVSERQALESDLARIEKEIPKVEVAASSGFRTIFPLNDLHRRIFSIQGKVWRAKGLRELIVWQKNRWDMLSPTEEPTAGGARIDVAMMKDEYRSAAFNVSNAGPGDAYLRLSIDGLPGGSNPDYVTVHEVPFTALPFAVRKGQHFHVQVPEGMTGQIWLTFHPKDVRAGEYCGKMVIEGRRVDIPVRLKLYPLTFPDEPTLHLGGWDYTDRENRYEVTPENRPALIRHLREHFVDTPWATSSVMPRGKYDKNGNMLEEPSTGDFRRWVSLWPNARNYYVFAAVGRQFEGFEAGTPAFEKAVAGWITWWVETLAKWDIRPGQLGLLLVDEPHSHEQDTVIIEYARVISNAQPQVVIWEDPTWREPWKARPELFELSTVLCPNLSMWIREGKRFADFYVEQRDAGRTLWFYSCSGPGKLLDPYSYHRMQHWFCWKYGARGSGFWAFGDSSGASSWNEYLSKRGAYTPLFLDIDSVTPGKHMEAIREGIEDYEYLRMLRDTMATRQGTRANNELVKSAWNLLDSARERVTSCMARSEMIYWKEPKDRSVADTVRIEILNVLVKLKSEAD